MCDERGDRECLCYDQLWQLCTRYPPLPAFQQCIPSTLSLYPLHCRTFYEDAIRAGTILNPVELLVVYVTQLLGYLFSLLLRIFMIVVILMPFFGLIRHARNEPGVGEVSQQGL